MTTGKSMVELARRLRGRRRELGLSLKDVRARGGPPPATVSRLETEESAPSVPALLKLAAALETTPGALLDDLGPHDDDEEGGVA